MTQFKCEVDFFSLDLVRTFSDLIFVDFASYFTCNLLLLRVLNPFGVNELFGMFDAPLLLLFSSEDTPG